MDAIFGHEAAELIRVRKLSSDELRAKEVRDHPELPGVKEPGVGSFPAFRVNGFLNTLQQRPKHNFQEGSG